MGFMDKAKEAAQQAKAQAQHMAQQGQAKVNAVQEARSVGELYRNLGEAVYAEQRHGGGHEAVETALAALDAHFASAEESAAAEPPADQSGAAAPPPTGSSTEPTAGNFTLNDM